MAWTAILAGCVLTVGVVVVAGQRHEMAVDMVNAYIPAARAFVHGASPYGLRPLSSQEAFVYPPIAAAAVAPLTVLSGVGVQAASVALTVAAVLGALWLAGVRDPRCFVAALGCCPMMQAVQTGNLVVLVALGAAFVWRFRDRPVVAGVAAGIVVSLKLFAWPLLLFFLLRRQWRATTAAGCTVVVALTGPWAAIGFKGLRGYPGLLASLDHMQRVHSYTVAALLAPALSWTRAEAVAFALGAAWALWAARRGPRELFVAVVGITLLVSPIVWMSYLVLVLVALAIARPSFGPLWLMPLLLWLGNPTGWAHRWQLVLVLAVAGGLLAAAERLSDPARVDLRWRPGPVLLQ